MDSVKIGKLIASLRKEKGLTQKNIADELGVVGKTVSKWECGLGCPDISLWADLSNILGVDMLQMMEGEITLNKPNSGNIDKVKFYVCPECGNILVSTGSSTIFCCSRKLEQLEINIIPEIKNIVVDEMDADYYISIDHPMTKTHYISFIAYVKSDTVILKKLYPEQSPETRLPLVASGKLYVYCTKHGLSVYTNCFKRK